VTLSKKDIIALNADLDTGRVVNSSSLDYAIATMRKNKNWRKACALIVRAILIDHVFEDGNKRTASAVIAIYLEMNGFDFNQDKVNQVVVKVLKNNITNTETIERLIHDAIN
jgi:prophage maintenance system killer protein